MVVVVALLLNLTHIWTKTTATAQSDLGRTTHDDDDNDAGGWSLCVQSLSSVYRKTLSFFFPFFLRLKKSFRFLSLSDSGVTFQEGVSDLFSKILRNIPPRHFHNSPSNLIHFSQFFPSCILIRIHPGVTRKAPTWSSQLPRPSGWRSCSAGSGPRPPEKLPIMSLPVPPRITAWIRPSRESVLRRQRRRRRLRPRFDVFSSSSSFYSVRVVGQLSRFLGSFSPFGSRIFFFFLLWWLWWWQR